MKPETTPSRGCVRIFSRRLNAVAKVARRGNGLHARLRCSRVNTRLVVEAILANESPAKITPRLDKTEVAD